MSDIRRGTATESRVSSFTRGANFSKGRRWQPESHHTEQGAQFASLTYQGQLYYADRVKEGAKHPEAYADARYSYGAKR